MSDRELLIGCDCAGTCEILAVTQWEWSSRDWTKDDADELILEFFERPGKTSLRWRLKNAWGVLRQHPYHQGGGGICLTDYRKVEQLRDFLTECLAARTQQKEERGVQ